MPRASLVYRMAAWVAFHAMAVQRWEFDVRGTEHLPTSGGAVIAANHTGFWDFFTIGRHSYYELGRPLRILAKDRNLTLLTASKAVDISEATVLAEMLS